jgi:sulfur-oxidizing protein SoxA
MKKIVITSIALSLLGLAPLVQASPQQDLKEFRAYFFKKFPGVELQDFANGIYGINAERRKEWEAMEEFPPYEPGVETGKELFTKYNVGKCFKNGGIGIRQNYPWFDSKTGQVHTLEADIMRCLKRNGVDVKAEKIQFGKGKLAAMSAYMAYTSRGKKLNVVVPNDPRALAIYEKGKEHFYAKRGQLNMACADCHMYHSGMRARANILSPALGHVSHFPVYRKKWELKSNNPTIGGFGTIQRRYSGCNKQVRALPLNKYSKKYKYDEQVPEYTALEYFETYMSNGIKVNAPGIRE